MKNYLLIFHHLPHRKYTILTITIGVSSSNERIVPTRKKVIRCFTRTLPSLSTHYLLFFITNKVKWSLKNLSILMPKRMKNRYRSKRKAIRHLVIIHEIFINLKHKLRFPHASLLFSRNKVNNKVIIDHPILITTLPFILIFVRYSHQHISILLYLPKARNTKQNAIHTVLLILLRYRLHPRELNLFFMIIQINKTKRYALLVLRTPPSDLRMIVQF